ncbi:unnamed protein product [Mycena citricolor]|uniref:Uncharacterized protein n=1 Tax=Mycena citricolor TaxID=2018698 RepID=A0AAD2Q2I9_9AGAR|nr:unnamed protein product [Mycena citricolor]
MDPRRSASTKDREPSPGHAAPEINPRDAPSATRPPPLTTQAAEIRRPLDGDDRREATQAMRRELQAAQDEARQLRMLLEQAAEGKRAVDERLARAEAELRETRAALRTTDQRTRDGQEVVGHRWNQLERHISALQQQAADARRNFSRVVQEGAGPAPVTLPPVSEISRAPPLPRLHPHHDILTREPPVLEPSQIPLPPREVDHLRRLTGPPRRSSSAPFVLTEAERVETEPPAKRRRRESPQSFPSFPRRPSTAGSSSAFTRQPRHPDTHHQSHTRSLSPEYQRRHSSPLRERLPAPASPHALYDPRTGTATNYHPYHPHPGGGSYPASAYGPPPLQIIQHRHPTPPPPPPPPPLPPSVPTGDPDAPYQYQHRFQLGTQVAPRRNVRPGAYETVVFALEPEGGGGAPTGGRMGGYDLASGDAIVDERIDGVGGGAGRRGEELEVDSLRPRSSSSLSRRRRDSDPRGERRDETPPRR